MLHPPVRVLAHALHGQDVRSRGWLHRHNHPSRRSRAYTKGKGPWRVAAAVFGLRSNRQSVWLERALKRHAKHRTRPVGLSAVQSAVIDAVRVSRCPGLWWRGGADQPVPSLHVQVFQCTLASWQEAEAALSPATLPPPGVRLKVSCYRQRSFLMSAARARAAKAAVSPGPGCASKS